VNKTGFPKTKRPDFSSLYLLFVIRLWTCLLTWVQTTYTSTYVNFLSTMWTENKNCRKVGRNLTCLGWGITLVCTKISKKFSKNIFFLKFHVIIFTEFETKRDKISGQTDKYSPTKKIKHFHTPTNLPFSPGSDQ